MFVTLLRYLGWLTSLVFSPVTLCLVVLLLTLGYLYISRNKNFWKGKGIANLPYRFPFGNNGFDIFSKPFYQQTERLYAEAKKAGGCIAMLDWVGPALVLSDPEMIKAVMVKDFETFPDRQPSSFNRNSGILAKMMTALTGQEWKDVRNISTPAFSTGKIRSMTTTLEEHANILAAQMFKESSADGEINMKTIMSRYTMDTIAAVAFGLNADSIRDPKSMIAAKAMLLSKKPSTFRIVIFMVLLFLPEFIKKHINLTGVMIDNEGIDFFVNITKRSIKEREDHPEQHRIDYLQLLLDTRRDDSQKRQLSDDEIAAQCLLFFFAGNDTTSNAMAWTARLLAFHPTVQERVQAEIDACLTSDDESITFDAVNGSMPYLDRVLAETLRMYPVMQNTRCPNRDYRIPGTEAVLPANSMVHMYPYAMQRDPDLYPNPDAFDPDRFLGDAKDSRSPYAYMPFGHGPRNCIGRRFAQLQAKVALVALLRRYSLVTGPKSGEIQPVMDAGFGQTMEKDGTWLKVVQR